MINQLYKLLKIEKEELVQIWLYSQIINEDQEDNKIEINLFMIQEMKVLPSLIPCKKSRLMFVMTMKIYIVR
jgi:hypothetical protein